MVNGGSDGLNPPRYLCMGPPIPEDPYLSRVRLVPWLARTLDRSLVARPGFANWNMAHLYIYIVDLAIRVFIYS